MTLVEMMGELIVERKKEGKSIGDYADGAMDMYNIVVKLIKDGELIVKQKGS